MLSFSKLYSPLFRLLPVLLLSFFLGGHANAQKVYATGTITGGLNGTGILAGTPYGLSRTSGGISIAGDIILVGIPTPNESNFYYAGSIRNSAGTPTGIGTSTILGASETTPIVVKANKSLSIAFATISGANSFIQFRYSSPITAGTTSYLKLKEKPVISNTLSLNLSSILGLTSTNTIVGEVYTGALEPKDYLLTQDQNTGTALGTGSNPTKTDLVINKNGEWYAAVTPTEAGTYNSVRLTSQFPGGLNLLTGLSTAEFNVYNAFTDAGAACNFRAAYTDEGKASGITLDVGGVISALDLSQLVNNPTKAIDDDHDTYSSISSGIATVGLLSTVSQSFYFDHKATTSDNLRLQLGLNPALLNLTLLQLGGIKIKGYNGGSTSTVFTKTLAELKTELSLNLLNLASINGTTHRKLDLTFVPGVVFDKIEISFEQGLLGVGLLGDAMRIYDVSMAASMPSITTQPNTLLSTNICEGSAAKFTVAATGSISSYQWQYYDGSSWVNQPSAASSIFNILSVTNAMNNRLYRVKVIGGTCPQELYSNEVLLTVNPRPSISILTGPTICAETTTALLHYTATTGTPTSYSIIWDNPLLNNVVNQAFDFSSGADISIIIPSGTPAATYAGSITVKNANGCVSLPIDFDVLINPKLPTPHLTITSN